LKRFMAFSKDSPSLTRTPVIRALSRDVVFEKRRKPGAAKRPAVGRPGGAD
jgi:hypothetical protein